MAEVRPFRAWRPAQGLAERIAALPYDVVNGKEAREETRREPFSFLAVDRPETQFEEENMDVTEDRVYERAGTLLRQWMKDFRSCETSAICYLIFGRVIKTCLLNLPSFNNKLRFIAVSLFLSLSFRTLVLFYIF